jgi:hypothetical protein
MFENYLLVPDAVAAIVNNLGNEFRPGNATPDEIRSHFDKMAKSSEYLKTDGPEFEMPSSDDWRVRVHGARMLSQLFKDLSGGLVNYDKVTHGVALTRWLCTHCRGELTDIVDLLREVVTLDV